MNRVTSNGPRVDRLRTQRKWTGSWPEV